MIKARILGSIPFAGGGPGDTVVVSLLATATPEPVPVVVTLVVVPWLGVLLVVVVSGVVVFSAEGRGFLNSG
jgi:hypothetical protein